MESGLAAVAFLALPLATPSAAASHSLLHELAYRYVDQFRTVRSFVVETDHFTMRHERITSGGRPGYAAHVTWRTEGDGARVPPVTYRTRPNQLWRLARRACEAGTARLEGKPTSVFEAPASAFVPAEAAFLTTGSRVRLHLCPSKRLPLGLDLDVVRSDARSSRLHAAIRFHDHRPANGLTVPFRVAMVVRENGANGEQQAFAAPQPAKAMHTVIRVRHVQVERDAGTTPPARRC